ncbi:protein of unknown function (plasmid) [Cupriavidus taiwanensis]|uniref:Uncharacterized protein n=1 Tax=Cupriavidus taiwanensis TaxID=164546 RepID=A0A9Q7V2K1_9BURK|nr:hypothetical protein CBM2585_P80016 [Cupriavidus taiwanensis]SPC24769.1 hypothetical protein CT19431_P70016 [Cupriavidus taiwanensis]SPD69243.1 protein of unknown function [Cupriavidus taiwanensis]
MGTQVPGLQPDSASSGQAAYCPGKSAKTDRTNQGTDAQRARKEPGSHDSGAESGAARVDRVLPAHPEQAAIGGAGRVDTAPAAVLAMAAGQEPCYPHCDAASARLNGGSRVALGSQRAGPMVECRGSPHGRGLPEGLLRRLGVDLAAGYSAALAVSFVNRRMRNRTYGGVRGLRG